MTVFISLNIPAALVSAAVVSGTLSLCWKAKGMCKAKLKGDRT